MNKTNRTPNLCVIALILCGMVLESIGGFLSRTTAIGFNFALSPLMYIGVGMIVVGFIAHFPLKLMAKKLNLDPVLLDLEAILMIVAIFFAVILLVFCIVSPVLFPANG